MRSTQIRIVVRLIAGFSAMLLLTVVMAVMAGRSMLIMADLANELYIHPFAVTNALIQVESQINAIRAASLTMIYGRSPSDVQRMLSLIAIHENEMAASMAVVKGRHLGDPDDVNRLSNELAQWKQIRDLNSLYCQTGEFDKAAENFLHNSAPQIALLRRHTAALYAFAQDKAAEFNHSIGDRRDQVIRDILLTLFGLLLLGALLARLITRSIVVPLGELREAMHRLANGDLDAHIPNRSRVTEVSRMAAAVEVFKQAALRLESERWVKDNVARLSPALQQTETIAEFAATALDFLVPLSGAGVAVFHARPGGATRFIRVAAWGLAPGSDGSPGLTSFAPGEGIAGEAARSGNSIHIAAPPESWLRVASATGMGAPAAVLAVPVMSRGAALAVMEFASFTPFTDDQRAVIEAALPMLALNIEILERNLRTRDLLEESQAQAEELKASEEELRAQGEALQAANEELRVSEEELKVQQEALQSANEELRLNAEALEARGLALEEARTEADRRAIEIEQASRYKSEFLANMSHELRTPLNSVLILARDLADNETGTLSDDQVESARIIHESGAHLLALINDVLDLSKVEAGKMSLDPVTIATADLAQVIRGRFGPVAADKGLEFTVESAPDLPRTMKADRGKIEQIANNLVSNAIKFTPEGGVAVRLALDHDGQALALSVADTGIGILPEDRQRVFAAFEQADSSTSRQFGGTGLGLTISRRLARLMGGDITLESNGDRGSVFTLLMPLGGPVPQPAPPPCAPEPPPESIAAPQAAEEAQAEEPQAEGRLLLVIEDDPIFRRVVCDMAKAKGFTTVTAEDGKSGLDLARLRRPCGIVLDIGLPGMSGWEVIETLRRQPETRDIPVHVISAGDERAKAAGMGTVGHLTKPVSREQINSAFEVLLRAGNTLDRRRLLLVDGDGASRASVRETLLGLNLDITVEETGEQALKRLAEGPFDCMVLDLALPDMPGGEFLERAERTPSGLPPVIVYSRQELSQDETVRIQEFTDSIVIKGARSSERLLDEVGLFLHAVEARKSGKSKSPTPTEPVDGILAGRTVLLVDDDMRNAFALSKVLRTKGLKVLIAQDGTKALSQLRSRSDVDLILLDIMMPGMDGYQTMGEIRKDPRYAHLPIIALTAKAMAGDRDRCLASGADDYLTKPVDVELLRKAMAGLMTRGHHAEPE
ncbi:Signal transduction histidine kinase [Paramagnetospirillum magnetotacticum MS-1]|uniref:histidine kinase n=1 Tax=Paramagnetospirillum magnetotacticum MS-1 TaxID=272627 RepID=A0A0C2YQ86_PARME|nr:response regulator [Paramagnetospirillum magnetotacticum]KIL96830.1 Signal transduction histidine kinase [Paramagnetospirillum magnetotacticum MS-1]